MSLNADSPEPNLLGEMWCKVFSYLFSEDLKSVRLTCRKFYEICNTSAIQKNEVLILMKYSLNTETIKSLANVKRKVWNIRLNLLELSEEPIVQFFLKNGADIHSLTLNKCYSQSTPESMATIIETLQSLRSFVIIIPRSTPYDIGMKNVLDSFVVLQKNNVILENVCSLTLTKICDGHDSVLNNKNFLSIFAVFPNIEKLEITATNVDYTFDDRNADPSELTSDEKFTFTSVYHQLFKMRDQLEKLKFHVTYQMGFTDFSIESYEKISQIGMKNLKDLSLNWIDRWDTPITNLFTRFNHLTEIECIFGNAVPISESAFIQLVVETLKELRFFKFRTRWQFMMERECFQALVRSNLSTLVISHLLNGDIRYDYSTIFDLFHHFFKEVMISAYFDQSSLEESLLPNYTLKHLRISPADNRLLSLFSTYFRRLDSFLVPEIQSDILHHILEYQTNLRCLQLYNTDHSQFIPFNAASIREWWRNRDPLSSNRLDYVTYLNIVEEDPFLNLLQFMADKLSFPKLKSLTIHIHQWYRPSPIFCIEPLLQSLPKFTQLDHLEIELYTILPFQKWTTLFKILSEMKLRYVYIRDGNPKLFDDADYRQLFCICPSLRVVLHGGERALVRYRCSGIKECYNLSYDLLDDHDFHEDIPNYYYKYF